MAAKVLIVDDSPLIRQVITDMLKNESELTVVGVAENGEEALQKIESLKPDVVTLDVEMPKMNGLECLAQIMVHNPLPVIMVSYLTLKGAEITIKALEIGAIDFVTKPSTTDIDSLNSIKHELIQKIKVAAGISHSKLEVSPTAVAKKEYHFPSPQDLNYDLLVIGASTGGPKALYYLLAQIPENFPLGIIIAQHMPKDFTAIFARRLNNFCELEVGEAKTGDLIKPGRVLVAPSGFQTKVLQSKKGLVVEVTQEPVLILKPSIDFLLKSVAECSQEKVISVILTGMGSDGAIGMKELRNLKARTIAQDEESCIIYGMPKAAFEQGGVEFVEDLANIFPRIVSIINE